MVLKSLLVCTAATSLIVATVPAATSPAQFAKNGMKIVRAYEVWKHHDPAAPQRTVAALEAADAECGASTGPFELLRLTTSREAAADIVRQIDDAGVPRAIEQAYARAFAALPGPVRNRLRLRG